MINILLIDDMDNWNEVFSMVFCSPDYQLKKTKNIEKAKQMVEDSDVILVNLHTMPDLPNLKTGFILFKYIKDNFPEKPRIAITSLDKDFDDDLEKTKKPFYLRDEYYPFLEHNDTFNKCSCFDVDCIVSKTMLEDPLELVGQIDNAITKRKKYLKILEATMVIIDQLTVATIGAGTKFLFDKLGEIVKRKNDEKLALAFEEKTEEIKQLPASSEQDVFIVKHSMKDLVCLVKQTADEGNEDIALRDFADWVQTETDRDLDNIYNFDELLICLLRFAGQNEQNPLKKRELLQFEATLKTKFHSFRKEIKYGISDEQGREIYMLVMEAVDYFRTIDAKRHQ